MLEGPELAKICKNTVPTDQDEVLLEKIQALVPDKTVRLAQTGQEWYRLGGVVDRNGQRVANDVIEWTERTFIECGKNLQTLIEHTRELQLLATRQTGKTLYFIVPTGKTAEQFIQIDIDKTHETSDRWLVGRVPPEDLEEFIDPLEPDCIDSFCIGTARYTYRRKTDVAVFMDEINKHHASEHPVQRFMDDWNRSSAGQNALLCEDWIIRPYRHVGRFNEQIINIELLNSQNKPLALLEDTGGKKGVPLHNLLSRFDRQIGYPFAWFFYMLKNQYVPAQLGTAVFKDISGDFSYLPERDIAVLKDWYSTPYSV